MSLRCSPAADIRPVAVACTFSLMQLPMQACNTQGRELGDASPLAQSTNIFAHACRDDANATFLVAVAAAAAIAGAGGALLLLTGGLKLHRRTSTSSRKKPAAEGCFVLAGPAGARFLLHPCAG